MCMRLALLSSFFFTHPTNPQHQHQHHHPKSSHKQSRYLRDPQTAESLDESAASASASNAGGPNNPPATATRALPPSAGGAPGVVDDTEGQISVYEAPSMELLDRKSIRAEGA